MSGVEDVIVDGEAPTTPEGWGMDGKGKMPTVEEIMAFIDQAAGISDEEKAQIKEDVIKSHNDRLEMLDGAQFGEGAAAAAAAGGLFAPNTLLFVGLLLLIALILGLFVYKIIKVEKDKENAKLLKKKSRDERRKNKTKRS